MADTVMQRLIATRSRSLRRRVADELVDLRESRDLSIREVAAAAGVDRRWLARAEAGDANLTLGALSAMATVLGTEASVRLYGAPGVRLRDHLQAQLISAVVARLHPRWSVRLEVPVYRPVRGVIDLVLVEEAGSQVVSGEAHSQVRRAERQLRWANEKTESLPSADGWPWTKGRTSVRRLLVLRSCAAAWEVVETAGPLFRAAYPGSTRAAVAALTTAKGFLDADSIIWVDLRGTASRLLDGPPRSIRVGR